MKRAARRIPVGACPCSLRRVATQGVPIRHPGGSLFCSARVGFPFTGYLIPPLILKNRTECRQGAGTDEQAAEPCRPPDQRPAVQQGAAEEHGALRRRAVRPGAGAPRRTLSSAGDSGVPQGLCRLTGPPHAPSAPAFPASSPALGTVGPKSSSQEERYERVSRRFNPAR